MKTKILVGGVDYTRHATMPLQEQKTADESLDAGYLELVSINQEKPVKPFTKCQIIKNDGTKKETEYYYIASDESNEIIKNKHFNHDLVLIEETKELERYIVDVKTLTNPIVRNYLDNPSKVMANGNTTTYWVFNSPYFISFDMHSPHEINTPMQCLRPYHLMSEIERVADSWNGNMLTDVELCVYDPDGELVTKEVDGWGNLNAPKYFTFTPTKEGDYKFKLAGSSTLDTTKGEASFIISVLKRTPTKDDYTIKQACEIFISCCETLRESEKPRFSLAQIEDYDEFMKPLIRKLFEAKSPEFSCTKCTLFEALKECGNYIHAIPRLRQGKIYFDLLGTNEKCDVNLDKYYSHSQSQSIDNFCSELDTNVENLLNTDDEKTGSIIEPFNNQYKTLRVEKGTAQITEDGVIIETEYPIYDIKSVEVGFLSNGTYVGDITPFIYEEAEYRTLSASGTSFPNAMMFALKYTQGQKNITGLTFKKDNLISSSFEGYAVLNVIHKKLNAVTNWWSNFKNYEDIYNLQFKITYTPFINTRLKQSKSHVEDLAFKSVLSYNQSSNMISSNAFGEHLRGVVAKYGVPEKKLMFTVSKLSEVPKVNTKYKDFTITSVKTETYNNFILVEVGMSKKFNNKSAYISINSQKRFYEISEKACAERFILYEDYCVIGDEIDNDDKSLITSEGINAFINSFSNGKTCQIGAVKAQGYTDEGSPLTEIAKPVFALGVGNSILFGYSYDDNYSAGSTASYEGETKVQEYVKYADVYGEIETLKVRFGRGTNEIDSYDMAVARGDAMPKSSAIPDGNFLVYFSTEDDKIVIKKDGREKISFSYQMHMITNRQNMIIGSGIGRKNVFTSREQLNYKLYILPQAINEFERQVDLENATEIELSVEDMQNNKIKIKDVVATADGKAWALVNVGLTNELLVGENISIKNGEEISLPFFNFTRKIRD